MIRAATVLALSVTTTALFSGDWDSSLALVLRASLHSGLCASIAVCKVSAINRAMLIAVCASIP